MSLERANRFLSCRLRSPRRAAEHADLLVAVTPGRRAVKDFRQLERIAEATLPHILGWKARPGLPARS